MYSLSKALFFAASMMLGAMTPAHAETNPGAHDHGSMAKDGEDRAGHMIEGIGSIVAVNASTHRVGLDHEPVPALNWPAMRMAFTVSDNVDLGAFKKGDKVQFTLHRAERGAYPIVELCLSSADKVVPNLCAPAKDDGLAKDHSDH